MKRINKLRPRGKGRKLVWQGAWHENTKGGAHVRSFFGNVDERGMLVKICKVSIQTYTYWGDVCWRGRGWEHMILIYGCTKRMRNFSVANMMWLGKIQKQKPSASEWAFGSAGRSNAVQNRKLRTRGRCACATWKWSKVSNRIKCEKCKAVRV